MNKETVNKFLNSRYVLWVFAISIQVIYTIVFWSNAPAENAVWYWLLGEMAVWASFIFLMMGMRRSLHNSFDILTNSINNDSQLPTFEFSRELNILARFGELVEYVLEYVRHLKNMLNITEDKYRKYLRFGDISMDVNFEYDFAKDTMYLSGNYLKVFGSNVTPVIPNFLSYVMDDSFIEDSQKKKFMDYIASVCRNQTTEESEWLFRKAEGNYEWFTVKVSYLEGIKEEDSRLIGIVRNINDMKQQTVKLQEKVDLEPMTHLYNRDAFVVMVNQQLDSINSSYFGVLMMVDIDDFKKYNDMFGHLTGDKVIIGVANCLRKSFENCTIARIGGDEFAVYMNNQSSDEDVNRIVDKFMIRIRDLSKMLDLPIRIGVSVGLAKAVDSCRYNELYIKADTALYTVKARGKNCYAWYDPNVEFSPVKQRTITLDEGISNVLFQTLRMNRENISLEERLKYLGDILAVELISVLRVVPNSDNLELYARYKRESTVNVPVRLKVNELLDLPFDETGVFYRMGQQEELIGTPFKSTLIYKLEKEGVLLGFYSFVQSKHESKIWSQSEIEALRISADSISHELYNKYVKHSISVQVKNMTAFLEALPSHNYLIDPETMELYYDNVKMLDSREKCYKALYNLEEPCPNCPAKKFNDSMIKCCQDFTSVTGEDYSVTINPFVWNNKKLLCLQLGRVGEKVNYTKQQETHRRLATAVISNFECVIEVWPEQDEFKVLLLKNNEIIEQTYVNYDNYIYKNIASKVEPLMRDEFVKTFNKQALLQAFEQGQSVVEMSYRVLTSKNDHYVKRRCILLEEDGKKLIYTYIVDIDDIMVMEESHKAKNDFFLQALAKTYVAIYEINVETLEFKTVVLNDSPISSMVVNGNYVEDITYRAENIVIESDRQKFLDFYNLNRLVNSFKSGSMMEQCEYQVVDINGEAHYVSTLLLSENKEANRILIYIKNIDERRELAKIEEEKRILEDLQERDARYRILAEHTNTLIFEWNEQTKKAFVDPKIARIYDGDYEGREIFAVWVNDKVVHPEDIHKLLRLKKAKNGTGTLNEVIVRLRLRDSNDYSWCRMAMTTIVKDGKLDRIIGTISNVTEQVDQQNELIYRSSHDILTGLYNIDHFVVHVDEMFNDYPERKYAILVVDINRFKAINDIYGRESGDDLLRFIAGTIDNLTDMYDVYGRMHKDVFVICLCYEVVDDIISFIHQLQLDIAKNQFTYKVDAHVGICLVEDYSIPVMKMVDWASLALNTVKGSYLKKYAFYDENLRIQIINEKSMENDMQESLENGEFMMYLQPKIDLTTNTIMGAEALVRWKHGEHGMLHPDLFIPLFEKNGFIVELDKFIWEEACKLLHTWKETGKRMIPISVNVSRMNIFRPEFYEYIIELVDKYDIPREYLELELTESVFLDDPNSLFEIMERFRQAGFKVSMDDFGSGYSSLAMLKDVPLDVLKIDRGFLIETVNSDKGKTIVSFIVLMASALQLKVIAEGVETQEQVDFLIESGCVFAQGYYFSKPVCVDEFEEFKKTHE